MFTSQLKCQFYIMQYSGARSGSISVSAVLRKSVRIFKIKKINRYVYIFNESKLQVEFRKQFSHLFFIYSFLPIIGNRQGSQTRSGGTILQRGNHQSLDGFIQGEWNWQIYCLTDSKSQERPLQVVKLKKFPQNPLGACSFGIYFAVYRSTFFLDPRLVLVFVRSYKVL